MSAAQESHERWIKRHRAATRVQEFLDARKPALNLDPEDIISMNGHSLTTSDLTILVEAVLA